MKEKPDVLQEARLRHPPRIRQIIRDLLAVNQGTLYPLLHKLEQRGSIVSQWGAPENNRLARFYRFTATSRKQLQVETRGWKQTAAITPNPPLKSVMPPRSVRPPLRKAAHKAVEGEYLRGIRVTPNPHLKSVMPPGSVRPSLRKAAHKAVEGEHLIGIRVTPRFFAVTAEDLP